ncbi:hypothetical protein TNIN_93801, partial [Trichonephila inaurata madagascariensis]
GSSVKSWFNTAIFYNTHLYDDFNYLAPLKHQQAISVLDSLRHISTRRYLMFVNYFTCL